MSDSDKRSLIGGEAPQAESDYRDGMTLDDMARNDMEMLEDAIKNADRYHFGRDMKKATQFVRECLRRTLKRLGGGIEIALPSNLTSKEAQMRFMANADRLMRLNKIKVERRKHYTGADVWRCGLYIYKAGELACFISDVLTEKRTEFDPLSNKISGQSLGFMVVTNARLDDTQRIFDMGRKTEAGIILPPSSIN